MSFKTLAKVFSISLVIFSLLVLFAPGKSFAQAAPTATPEPCFENDQQVPCPTNTPEPSATPCVELDENTPVPCPTSTPEPTATPCLIFGDDQSPSPCPTEDPTPTPGDMCTNLDGFQGNIPDGWYQLNTDSTVCRQFDIPGPGDGSGSSSNGGGTTSTGQVLGASTLAATGTNTSTFGIFLMIFGLTLSASSVAYAFRKTS